MGKWTLEKVKSAFVWFEKQREDRYNDAGWQRPLLRKETYLFQWMEDQNLWSGTDVDNEMAFKEYIFSVQRLKATP